MFPSMLNFSVLFFPPVVNEILLFLVYLIIKTRIAWNAGRQASLQRLLASMAIRGAWQQQDSDSTTQGPQQGGHLWAGRARAQPGQARGLLQTTGSRGAVSSVRHGHGQTQENMGTKERPSLSQTHLLLPENRMDGSSHITFYSICAAWALLSTN